ncbi:MAG: molybdopterin molybdenumtransferase MoeA, partial [Perlucidibaca sp.]
MALLTVDQAQRQLLAAADAWRSARAFQPARLALAEADGRVLAEAVHAGMPVPPEANSAMDGYAICHADLGDEASPLLPVSLRIPAGTAPGPLPPGTAARIFTGAVMPPGADTVVMQENCETLAGAVRVLARPRPGETVRAAGQDVASGDCLGPA